MSLLAISEQAINGLIIGSFYALTALGLAVIFGVLRIVNFAHGELYMLGGYAYYLAIASLGIPPLAAILIAVAALFVIGAAIEGLLIRPIHTGKIDRPDEYAIMITFALSVFLLNLANSVFGPWPQRPEPLMRGRVEIGELIISGDRLAAASAAIVMIAIVVFALRYTWAGKAVRAVSQDRQAAEIYGISVQRAGLIAFGTGAALAGLAGALIGPVFNVVPIMGVVPVIKAYIIVVLGGLGSIPGAIIGAIILGQVESFATILIPDPSRALAYKDAYGLIVLVAVLLLRPQGLFGTKDRRA
ncbi:putative branched-chain amino acid transport permease [Fulvimarina pelagi HTCC2506]|uniref:Putative branched-chain amino acid transport permease n=1 Tax=Fulvimarina pelagi HTCC2506 TaxID=314231 RepID=Q0FY62_9HYPH|nr:branched-chain amino acid ABC transporter permease [Fulvimarina pelagi]EAU39880.1 putative branched-chain amino acid transport permease [Fulvimarina pelagi HTCC2506]